MVTVEDNGDKSIKLVKQKIVYTRAKNAVMYLVLRHLTCLTQVFRIQKFKLKLMNDNFTWVDSLHRICVHQF